MKKGKIPTAAELFEKRNPQDGKLPQWAKDLMIEFTKLHVQKALQSAEDAVEEYRAWGDTDKIKKSYPLTKIK